MQWILLRVFILTAKVIRETIYLQADCDNKGDTRKTLNKVGSGSRKAYE